MSSPELWFVVLYHFQNQFALVALLAGKWLTSCQLFHFPSTVVLLYNMHADNVLDLMNMHIQYVLVHF
jgi:hypothetical protein